MSLVKSILAGLFFLIAAAILLPLCIGVVLALLQKPGEQEATVGFDVIALAKSPFTWVVVLMVFAAGFFWGANWGKTD